jgi:hypothetical protein
LFPKAIFAVGADTFNRIGIASYYSPDPIQGLQKLVHILDEWKEDGTRFLVYNRKGVEITTTNSKLIHLAQIVPVSEYEDDGHSSTKERLS